MTSGSSPFSASNPIKVMVVDDSAVIRGFLVKILESCPDIEVKSIAANGLIAVNNLSKNKHDIIILDVEMPVMDGLSAIPRLLSIQSDVKIFMFSTLTTENAETTMRALALGAALGTVAVIVRQEIVLAIMGGIFVVEALSVMLQVSYFKYTKRRYGAGRRILKMAPLHHHFEKSGWKETQVVVRFWIITMLLCLVGLSTLKLR